MAENIVMPKLGESITEGTIVKWLKKIGQDVEKDENILLISTDKVEAEIPSPASGTLLSIIVKPGETVAVGTVLGEIAQINEKSVKKESLSVIKKQTDINPTAKFSNDSTLKSDILELPHDFLSPLVRRIMQKNNINKNDITSLNGSGHNGRINKKDILDFIKKQTLKVETKKVISSTTIINENKKTTENISSMRKTIMQNMIASKQTSAHVTTFFDVDYTKIDTIRYRYKDQFLKEEGLHLTYTAFLATATSQVLKRHPYINAEIKDNKIVFKKYVNLGIAVSFLKPEPGLMVPVIKNCDQINLRGIAKAINNLSNKVRTKNILPDELFDSTFTITNPGNYGSIIGTPIINQPQVAILGVGQIKKRPVIMEVDGSDVIGIRNIGIISLSFDHRLVDGVIADIFMADLKKTLENWTNAL